MSRTRGSLGKRRFGYRYEAVVLNGTLWAVRQSDGRPT